MNNTVTTAKNEFRFLFTVDNPGLATFTHLILFNGYNQVISEGYGGKMDVIVPSGLYQLRIEMNEFIEDRNYRIDRDFSDSIGEIKTQSSMPLKDFSSTNEYLVAPSEQWSRMSTKDEKRLFGSSVFLFLTYSDSDFPFDRVVDPEKGFLIVNEEREIVFTLDKTNTQFSSGKADHFFGTVSFHEQLSPGQYYLIYRGKNIKREIPMYVFPDWQTQVFIAFKNHPIFGSTKISIERNGFSSHNSDNIHLDAIIQKMFNGIHVLPDDLIRKAAEGKWENPMLGILAAYMYLQTNDNENDNLFQIILRNLEQNILRTPDAPDLVALRLLGAMHFKQPLPKEPLKAPSMIAVGMDAFLKQSMENEKLIPRGGIVERIYPKLRCDSIWTAYEPLPVKRKKTDVNTKVNLEGEVLKRRKKRVKVKARNRHRTTPNYNWITTSIFNQLAVENKPLGITNMASQLQITRNVVRVTLSKLVDKNKLNSIAVSVLGKEKVNIAKTVTLIKGLLKEDE